MTVTQERPTAPLRQWRAGQRIKADTLNRVVDATTRIIGGVRPPMQLQGLDRRTRDGNPQGLQVRQFRVLYHALYVDFILCDTMPTGGADFVRVALPWSLQRTPWHNVTRNWVTYEYQVVGSRTRTATDEDENVEWQIVTPAYEPDDIIFAIGPQYTGITDDLQEDPVDVMWQDLNVDARMWMRQYEQPA